MADNRDLGRPITTGELKEWFGDDWERVGWRLVVNAPAEWPLSKLRQHVRRLAESNAADVDTIAGMLWWVWNALGPNDNMADDWESQTKLAMNHGGAYEDEVRAFRAMAALHWGAGMMGGDLREVVAKAIDESPSVWTRNDKSKHRGMFECCRYGSEDEGDDGIVVLSEHDSAVERDEAQARLIREMRADAVLAAIRGAGYEVAREECGDGARG